MRDRFRVILSCWSMCDQECGVSLPCSSPASLEGWKQESCWAASASLVSILQGSKWLRGKCESAQSKFFLTIRVCRLHAKAFIYYKEYYIYYIISISSYWSLSPASNDLVAARGMLVFFFFPTILDHWGLGTSKQKTSSISVLFTHLGWLYFELLCYTNSFR